MANARASLRRWHTWLGWLVGIPVLLWSLSGLVMVWKPIEEVRGEHLLREPGPVRLTAPPVAPAIAGTPVANVALQQRSSGPQWVIELADGTTQRADATSGRLLGPLTAEEAVREVAGRYTGESKLQSVTRIDGDSAPLEYRRDSPAWQVSMNDGTNFYVDAASGQIVARRTAWWRFYDLMWGLHIMDLKTREDTHNPLVIGFGIAALTMSLLALALLPMTVRRRRARRNRSAS